MNPVNDVKHLLELALADLAPGDGRAPASGQPCDPAADLARGRRLLRRRRRRLAGLAGVAAVVLGGALVPLALSGPGTATGRTAVATASSAARSRARRGPIPPHLSRSPGTSSWSRGKGRSPPATA